jgi:hypothetical protein
MAGAAFGASASANPALDEPKRIARMSASTANRPRVRDELNRNELIKRRADRGARDSRAVDKVVECGDDKILALWPLMPRGTEIGETALRAGAEEVLPWGWSGHPRTGDLLGVPRSHSATASRQSRRR